MFQRSQQRSQVLRHEILYAILCYGNLAISPIHAACMRRADALRFLGLLMGAAPRQVAGGFLLPALQQYAHLLAPSQRVRSVKAGSIKALLQARSSKPALSERYAFPAPCRTPFSKHWRKLQGLYPPLDPFMRMW